MGIFNAFLNKQNVWFDDAIIFAPGLANPEDGISYGVSARIIVSYYITIDQSPRQ